MTPQQCRMARVGLGLGVRELAELADVSTNTISRLERGESLYPRRSRRSAACLKRPALCSLRRTAAGRACGWPSLIILCKSDGPLAAIRMLTAAAPPSRAIRRSSR